MKKIIEFENITEIIKELKEKNKSIVLVGGCFDILHKGHISFLKKAKEHGDILIVLLESDETLKRIKGEKRPINNQRKRAEILLSLKSVDLVFCIPHLSNSQDYRSLVKKIEPDIIAVTNGDPLFEVKKEHAESVGGKIVEVIKRQKQYSTTAIIKNIM